MELVIKPYHGLPCELEIFTINGKAASIPSRFMIINSVRDEEVSITSGIDLTYSELVEYYTFIDGTPFGVKGEE